MNSYEENAQVNFIRERDIIQKSIWRFFNVQFHESTDNQPIKLMLYATHRLWLSRIFMLIFVIHNASPADSVQT